MADRRLAPHVEKAIAQSAAAQKAPAAGGRLAARELGSTPPGGSPVAHRQAAIERGRGSGAPPRGSGSIAEAVRIWKEEPFVDKSAANRDRLMRLWIQAEVLRLTNIRGSQNRKAGNPGPEGSIAKLMFAEINMDVYELCVDLLGAAAMVDYDFEMRRSENLGLIGAPGTSRKMFLRARANSIEGGTSEIQRNILGERILGLPGEPRSDKAIPWKDVPRS